MDDLSEAVLDVLFPSLVRDEPTPCLTGGKDYTQQSDTTPYLYLRSW